MRKLGIISRCDRDDVIALVNDIVSHLRSRAEVLIDFKTAEKIHQKGTPMAEMRKRGAEFIVSIGGDGTVLRGIQKMDDPLPVLGINMGTFGFLVDVNPEDALMAIDKALSGFEVEERSRLAVMVNDEQSPPATNEVVIITANPAKILHYRIFVDKNQLEDLRADGMVFATPTGSTAYAMSAGGPIVDPRVDGTVIVPLAPFKLSARPWVVPAQNEIRVELVIPKKEAVIVIDGQYTRKISENDRILITKADKPARFVMTRKDGFYEKVRSKLS
ncbi:putative sugar kinase [Candidatus Methanoperedens nitroreducens]|uniref:NAD kinase n=1 Tax=Candidatus Methanoperedens nitratireducens TaxID=1392998 RepID=A0A062V8B0_9EURY|nr:NAD(+)/NADH kinase [Candidatus Methanoperedens nitroreducens]KCZ73527.1 putative sugar kinase [Candidatus Methanoperedens nitroreducens]MDJ1422515.1 NAD(+)/NADH kinase [Candidatus Methanoperedens sp.]